LVQLTDIITAMAVKTGANKRSTVITIERAIILKRSIVVVTKLCFVVTDMISVSVIEELR